MHSNIIPEMSSKNFYYDKNDSWGYRYHLSWMVWRRIKWGEDRNKDLFNLFFNLIGITDQKIINILFEKYMSRTIFDEVKKYYLRIQKAPSIDYTRDMFIAYLNTLPNKDTSDMDIYWGQIPIRTYDAFLAMRREAKQTMPNISKPKYSSNGTCIKTKNGRKLYRYF